MKVDFFIVGAPKAGTTSLYYYLSEHPGIEMSSKKETNFFSHHSIQKQSLYYNSEIIDTLDLYHSLFKDNNRVKYGEASVSYLYYNDVPQKIKEYNSEGKIIIMLRDLADRAFSHYQMDFRLGLVNAKLEDIIDNRESNKRSQLFYQQYIELSMYYNQVKRYIDTFGRENIHIIFYEDFNSNIELVVKGIYDFLEVDKSFIPELDRIHNMSFTPRNSFFRMLYSWSAIRKFLRLFIPKKTMNMIKNNFLGSKINPKLSIKLRQKMNRLFLHDIELLEDLLSKDLSIWKK